MTILVLALHHSKPVHDALVEALEGHDVEVRSMCLPGLSSAYVHEAQALRDAHGRILPGLLSAVHASRSLEEYSGVLLVSWSAGYGLVELVLDGADDAAHVLGWVALDSGYATPNPGVYELARRAREGTALYFGTYTDVPTSGYASTGAYLKDVIAKVGAPEGLFNVEHLEAPPAVKHGLSEEGLVVGSVGYWKHEHVKAVQRGPLRVVAALEALAKPQPVPIQGGA